MFQTHRQRFLDVLAREGAAAIVATGTAPRRNHDCEYRFRPHSDFFYLTGFREPDALLVLRPEAEAARAVLFLRERDPEQETWTGRRLGVAAAPAALGVDRAYPIEELSEALELHKSHLPKLVLAGGIAGLVGGMGLEYWASVIEYPMNIGGRPFFSWPAFIIPAYETTILFAAGAAVFGMLALNGLPEPYHPVFNVPGFALASRDKFFICIEAADPKFDRVETARYLKGLGASVVSEVEH